MTIVRWQQVSGFTEPTRRQMKHKTPGPVEHVSFELPERLDAMEKKSALPPRHYKMMYLSLKWHII